MAEVSWTGRVKEALYRIYRPLFPELGLYGLRVPTAAPQISRKIFKQLIGRTYEKPEVKALLAVLRRSDRVMELGSGLGIVSAVAARHADKGVVRTYEGNPELLDHINTLHRRNGLTSITLFNEILLPAPMQDHVAFNVHPRFAESSVVGAADGKRQVLVPCRDVNAVLAEFRPDVLICDIEGGEELLFDGIDLTGVRAFVIELHPHVISRVAVRRIFDTCAQAGLYPRVELSSGTVVAFERVDPP